MPPPGYDPGAFVAPPRAEYDYSPLDLQPPGQRRKRQIIAGIIGALVVVAIGALIVAGWMALRDDEGDPVDPTPPDRVAQLSSTPTETSSAPQGETTPSGNTEAAPTQGPTAPPEPTAPQATIYDSNSIRAALPVVEMLPPGFVEAGDTQQDLAAITSALTCNTDPSQMLSDLGWQAAMQRNFTSNDPATTGSTSINVSVHAFKDEASANAAVTEYANILECFQWTRVEGEQIGGASQIMVWTDPETEEDAVTLYFTDGQLLYRVFAKGPPGFDSTPNAIDVARRILGG